MTTRFILPKIKARSKEGIKGAVINLSSVCGDVLEVAGGSIYSGTKAFNMVFSNILSKELAGVVDVIAVNPGPVKTNLNQEAEGLFGA